MEKAEKYEDHVRLYGPKQGNGWQHGLRRIQNANQIIRIVKCSRRRIHAPWPTMHSELGG